MSVDSFSVNPFVGFGCAGYRSFSGAEPARIGPFDKVGGADDFLDRA